MPFKITAALLFAIALAAGTAGMPEAAGRALAAEPQSGKIIVRFRPTATLAGVGAALGAAGREAESSAATSRLVVLAAAPGQPVDTALTSLRSDPAVEFAVADSVVHIAATPNDTYYPSQWHFPQVGLPAAWDAPIVTSGVIVAVVDTGVMLNHPDLDSKITTGANAGWDFVGTGDSDPSDDHGHGTFIAGIIGAESNNNSWVAGVCWSCKIMPVKVMAANGTGYTSDIIEGINHAVTNGAAVINLSLGTYSSDPALAAAVQAAWDAGVVVVGASGNDNTGTVLYPAAYSSAIAVGANDNAGVRATWTGGGSNWGPELDVMAPGKDVVSTIWNGGAGGYGAGTGTSFATPHVAGLAGLMIARGITDNDAILARLTSTTTDMGTAGYDVQTGWGRINAAAAVADQAPGAALTSPAAASVVSGTVSITATATDDIGVSKVRFWAGATYLGYDTTAPYSVAWDTTLSVNGNVTIKAEAVDTADQKAAQQYSVTVSNTDTTPPSVSITSPADGAPVSGSAVTISATASDNVAVQKVQFFAGSTYLGYDTTAPYTKAWDSTLAPNGARTLRARAFDNAGNYTDTTINVTISNSDAVPPTVGITSPADGATVSGSAVTISATASDNVAVQKVQFWAGGTYLGYDTTAPYTKAWNSTGYADGQHTLKARAVDNAGNYTDATISVTVSNSDAVPPTASITSPANGATVSGSVTIAVNASDNVAVQKVQFWADGTYLGYDTTAPYTKAWNSNGYADGTHTLKARAVDNAGNFSPEVTITVDNTDANPTVSITGPADGATVAGTINITASASDDVGLNKVQFWVDGTYLGYDTTAPYAKTWDSATVPNGSHTIKARAVDSAGQYSAEMTITITVSN